ncbi:MAG: CRISPR system precrRNA processing endoribonuclease RAMP protein Cas6 [Acidobacteriota bacterium]
MDPDLTVSHYAWSLEAEEPIVIPHANTGNNLRGAFGLALKRLACGNSPNCQKRCANPDFCAYAHLFESTPPVESRHPSGIQDIPRPFVLKPSRESRSQYAAGDRLDFGLVLAGNSRRHLPLVAMTFKELEQEGLGISRGRFRLKNIVALDKAGQPREEVYNWKAGTFRNHEELIRLSDFKPESGIESIEVQFLTPVYLKADGQVVQAGLLQFHHLAKRLRDRISSLACFYGDGELQMDFREFGSLAEKVECTSRRLAWVDGQRKSSRTGLWHNLGGLVGRASFRGDLTPFWPFLKLGELVHCGKYATFGQGEFRVQAGKEP